MRVQVEGCSQVICTSCYSLLLLLLLSSAKLNEMSDTCHLETVTDRSVSIQSGSEAESRSEEETRKPSKTLGYCLCFGHMCLGVVFSLLAPFFPRVAQSKNLTPIQYSIIFGVYQFGIFIFSPFIGCLLSKNLGKKELGKKHQTLCSESPQPDNASCEDCNREHFSNKSSRLKNFLVWSLIITSSCNLLFGCIGSSNLTDWPYFWLTMTLRLMESVGGATFLTASGAAIMTFYPDRVSTLYVSFRL